MFGLEVVEEALRHHSDVECLAQLAGDLDDGNVARVVELAQREDHRRELADEEVAGLALEVEVGAHLVALLAAQQPRP